MTTTAVAAPMKNAQATRRARLWRVASMMAPAGVCTRTVVIDPTASAKPMPAGFQW